MRRRAATPLLVAVVAGSWLAPAGSQSRYDLVVRGGRVLDGAGNPPIRADVAVSGDRIQLVGRVEGAGRTEIDAAGHVVAPGFIDVHAHAENIVEEPAAENFLRMGVTTLVTGNCGAAALDTREFLTAVAARRPGVNLATLAGHNVIRRTAMGGNFDRPPTAEELAEMRRLLAKSMADGAVGLSTGLIYLPGTFSQTEEIVELARTAAAAGGLYASHMRNEGTRIDQALDELLRISREAGIRAQVSHLKLGSNAAWGRSPAVLGRLDRAREEGIEVTHDQYAYTASSTTLSQMIPSFAREGGDQEYRKRLDDPATRAKIVEAMKEALRDAGRQDYTYAVIGSFRADPSLNGKTIPQAAQLIRGAADLENQIALILDLHARGSGQGIYHGMNEADVRRFMQHPHTMIASDSGVRVMDGTVPHPRGYGNNARVLGQYVRELKLLRLEDAVRKMTSLPAGVFRLMDRGLIRPGCAADLVVFDPATIADRATFEQPHQYAAGVQTVIINGRVALDSRGLATERAGRPLTLAAPPRSLLK